MGKAAGKLMGKAIEREDLLGAWHGREPVQWEGSSLLVHLHQMANQSHPKSILVTRINLWFFVRSANCS